MANVDLSRRALARELGVSVPAIDKWRAGEGIRAAYVPDLSFVLKLSPAVLLGKHYEEYADRHERNVLGPMRAFGAVAARIDDLRGRDPENPDDPGATITELRVTLLALDGTIGELRDEIHELQQEIRDLREEVQSLKKGKRKKGPGRDDSTDSPDEETG